MAALIVPDPTPDLEAVVRVAGEHGIAVILAGDAGEAPRTDGVQVRAGADIAALRERHPIVGINGVESRHEAMTAAEQDPDYLFFGRLAGREAAAPHPAARALAGWWAEIAVVPAVLMGGTDLASVESVAAHGIEFVALREAVWADPRGPAAAVRDANAVLERRGAAA